MHGADGRLIHTSDNGGPARRAEGATSAIAAATAVPQIVANVTSRQAGVSCTSKKVLPMGKVGDPALVVTKRTNYRRS